MLEDLKLLAELTFNLTAKDRFQTDESWFSSLGHSLDELPRVLPGFLPPPSSFTLSSISVDPRNPNDPTIADSNPSGNTGSSGSSGSTSTTANSSSSSSGGGFTLSTYSAGGINLSEAAPEVDPSRDYNPIAMFWRANSLWLLVQGDSDFSFSNNAGRNRTFLYRSTPKDDTWNFEYQDVELYDYVITSNTLILDRGDRTIFVAIADRVQLTGSSNGSYSIESQAGLLEVSVSDGGQASINYIEPLSDGGFERPFFAFDGSAVLLNTSNARTYETKLRTSSPQLDFYNYESRGERDFKEGFPLNRGHIRGAISGQSILDLEANTTPGNVYAQFIKAIGESSPYQYQWDIYYVDESELKVLSTIYTPDSFSAPTILQSVRDDGSYALSVKYRDAGDPNNLKTVVDFYYRRREQYQWQFNGSILYPESTDANRVLYDRYASSDTVWRTDRFGNGFFGFRTKSIFYKAGSNAAIDIGAQLNGQWSRIVCNSPFGFIVLTYPQFQKLFGTNSGLFIVQSN